MNGFYWNHARKMPSNFHQHVISTKIASAERKFPRKNLRIENRGLHNIRMNKTKYPNKRATFKEKRFERMK